MRKIYLCGDIDEAAYEEFSKQLTIYERQNCKVIDVELSSGGGTAMDALAFASRMRLSNCGIRVTAYGLVASAATLVLAAGDYRLMTKEAWVMLHEDSGKVKGSVSELEKQSKHLRRMEDQWNNLMASHTNVDTKTWAKLHKETIYLNPEQCLRMGLVDKII
jgi:ATP-dependent Clp protease, protease subunit